MWTIVEWGELDPMPEGRDWARAWKYRLENRLVVPHEQASTVVGLSMTAARSRDLVDEAAAAITSAGLTAVQKILWKERPPRYLVITTSEVSEQD